MIELTILNYLKSNLTIPVVFEEINDTEYVLIQRTGSSETNFIKSSTFAIQSYSDTLYNATVLNETIKTLMKNIIELDAISDCSLNTDYNYTDATKKHYRYQAVFEVVHY